MLPLSSHISKGGTMREIDVSQTVGSSRMIKDGGKNQDPEAFVTDLLVSVDQFVQAPKISNQVKSTNFYTYDEAEPQFNDHEEFNDLPERVHFERIIVNVMNALGIKKEEEEEKKTEGNETREGQGRRRKIRVESQFEKWQKYLNLRENQAIISDCFWYAHCQFKTQKDIQKITEEDPEQKKQMTQNKEVKYQQIEDKFLQRIAKNYVSLFLSIEDKFDNDAFFEQYFDIVSQSVFYGFFYAFPKSRAQFNDELKKDLLEEFSYLFTGIPISNSNKYFDAWNLDLGAGNILKKDKNQLLKEKEQNQITLPSLSHKSVLKPRNQRNPMTVRFSPLIKNYLESHQYQTKEIIQGFTMKFTQYDQNQDAIEDQFQKYNLIKKNIVERSQQMKEDNEEQQQAMDQAIKEFKKETVKHHRRLEKRKIEELQRGAHEYANYLVSMLNAGLNMANLGVNNAQN